MIKTRSTSAKMGHAVCPEYSRLSVLARCGDTYVPDTPSASVPSGAERVYPASSRRVVPVSSEQACRGRHRRAAHQNQSAWWRERQPPRRDAPGLPHGGPSAQPSLPQSKNAQVRAW